MQATLTHRSRRNTQMASRQCNNSDNNNNNKAVPYPSLKRTNNNNNNNNAYNKTKQMHAKTAAQNACWARSAHMRARTAACWWEVMRCAFRCWFVAFAVVFASPLCSVRVQGPADRLLHSVPNSEICFDTTCVHLSFEIFNRSIAENSYSNQAFDLCRKTESEFNTFGNGEIQ